MEYDFDKNLLEDLEKKYGKAVPVSTNGNASELNYMVFAELFTHTDRPVYEPAEKKIYFYDEETGLWKYHEKHAVIKKICDMICAYADACQKLSIKRLAKPSAANNIYIFLMSFAEQRDFFSAREEIFIHCGNGVLVYDTSADTWNLKAFSPDFHSRNSTNIIYDQKAQCPQFIEKLLLAAITEQDASLLQFYAGQCLIGKNLSQTFLILTGAAGSGKSTFVDVLENLIGTHNCTELRLGHMNSRFELQRFVGKTLLHGVEVKSNFLMSPSAHKLKALVGNDKMVTESKGINETADVEGNFNVIITANSNLYITFDGDEDAWRRRMLWIKYENLAPREKINHFAKKLIAEEGSGILNWALEGAKKLMSNKGEIPKTPGAMKEFESFIQGANPLNSFLKDCLKPVKGATVTGNELLKAFTAYTKSHGWDILPERMFQKLLPDAMLKIYNAVRRNDVNRDGKNQRGYYGFQLDSGLDVNPEQAT